MSIKVLEIIASSMAQLGLAYDFGMFTKQPLPDVYFVGEYQETESITEDGLQESTFILTGFTRGSWLALEEAKEKIENRFNQTSGQIAIADNGNAVAIFYAQALIVPTGDAELKRIEINLHVNEWKVTI